MYYSGAYVSIKTIINGIIIAHYIVMVLENGDDDMPALLSYKCPSCGANLKVSPDEIYVKCAFCGTTAQRQLTTEEQARVAAKRLAKKVEQYKNDIIYRDRSYSKCIHGW